MDKKLICVLCSTHIKPIHELQIITPIGHIISPDSFTMGINTYKLLKDKFKFDKGIICQTCADQFEYIEDLSVECHTCHKKFHNLYGQEDQGNDCASTICENLINSGYGSKYDAMDEYECVKYVDKKPTDLVIGANICDDCITDLINKGICKEY